jgi:hypothetical protein
MKLSHFDSQLFTKLTFGSLASASHESTQPHHLRNSVVTIGGEFNPWKYVSNVDTALVFPSPLWYSYKASYLWPHPLHIDSFLASQHSMIIR